MMTIFLRIQVLIRKIIPERFWLFFVTLGITAILFETLEHFTAKEFFANAEFLGEILFTGLIIPTLGLTLISLLRKTEDERLVAINKIYLEEELIAQLRKARRWDELIYTILHFPQNFLPVISSQLLMGNATGEAFEVIASWGGSAEKYQEQSDHPLDLSDRNCNASASYSLPPVTECTCTHKQLTDKRITRPLCIPLVGVNMPLTLLHLYLPIFITISEEQTKLLKYVASKMALALDDMWLTYQTQLQQENFENERKRISHDLHDTLGQDLAYLYHKLDQLANDGYTDNPAFYRKEIQRMRDIADEAYQVVRGTLVSLQAGASDNLVSSIEKHSAAIADRSGLAIQFTLEGTPVNFPYFERYQIFYIFRELIANVEKHAKATRVDICMHFCSENLTLMIRDDGVGFNLEHRNTNGHFGLMIINERVRQLNGEIVFQTSPQAGTLVSVTLPLRSPTATAKIAGFSQS